MRALLSAGCRHTTARTSSGTATVPVLYEDGLFFVSDIAKGGLPGDESSKSYHLPVNRGLDPEKLSMGMYRRESYQLVKDEMALDKSTETVGSTKKRPPRTRTQTQSLRSTSRFAYDSEVLSMLGKCFQVCYLALVQGPAVAALP